MIFKITADWTQAVNGRNLTDAFKSAWSNIVNALRGSWGDIEFNIVPTVSTTATFIKGAYSVLLDTSKLTIEQALLLQGSVTISLPAVSDEVAFITVRTISGSSVSEYITAVEPGNQSIEMTLPSSRSIIIISGTARRI